MATKKQRRRREKDKRHDYEIVYLDSEGNEVEPEETDERPAPRKAARTSSRSNGAAGRGSRRRRQVQPPSWRRVARRGALFGPVFLATVFLLGGKRATLVGAVVQTLVLVAIFVPFSYFMDKMLWRSHQRRLGSGSTTKR